MAIVILKRGTDPAEQPIKTTCNNCKTEFTFLPSDAKYMSDQREGDYYAVVCPCCPTTVTKSVRG